MRRVSILFAAMALTAACDSAEPSDTAQPSEAQEQQDDADDEELAQERGDRHGKGRHGDPGDQLCETVGCTDQQRAEIDALFEREHDRERPDDSAANQALAKAFRSDAFSPADLEAYKTATRGKDDRIDEHVEKMEALHGILTAEQRVAFADEIAENGFMRHGGGKGRHDGKFDKKADGSKFVAHKVEKLCEPLACTDDQVTKLTAIVSQAKAERPEKDEGAHHKALADAMRAETFDSAAVKKQLEAGKARHAERGEMVVAIHTVLTAAQRDKVADQIETEGPGALIGHRGKHGGKKFRQR
jgi:Spy/CpxP family protein refolding chaperone